MSHDHTSSESEVSKCNLSNCYESCRGNVICPPCDHREQYEFSSEKSCLDFSELCEDKPKIICEKKDKSETKSDESDSDSEYESTSHTNCGGCGNCNQCSDYSVTSVVKSLSTSSCTEFSDLVNDKNKPEQVEHSSKKESSSKKGKRFIFTFGNKEGHAWADYNQGSQSIYVNGKNGPVLHLYRESTYFFCIEQKDSDNTLLLTNSPVGGVGSKIIHGGFEPISKGCVCVKVDSETPRYFYYQSSKNQFQGGLVIVHDEDK